MDLKKENENLRKQLSESEEESNELETMKRILMAEIRELRFPHKIKRHFQLYFGIPQESPEKLQLDQLMLKLDSINTEYKKGITALRVETKSEMRIIKWALIALGAVFTGAASLPELLRFLGLG